MSSKYVPNVSRSPLKLALSLLFSENPSARSALLMALGGLVCAPVDMMLSGFERRKLAAAEPPKLPIVLVCGPPRSGTTLVAQYLINSLDVAYFSNLTSLFPRAPITVSNYWKNCGTRAAGSYSAFYGKSQRLSGTNDALYIWDRWLGSNRRETPDALQDGAADSLPRFLGAYQRIYDKPIVNKVNRLNVCAHIVAPLLPTAYFVFVERKPLWLAQSLYVARQRIGNDLNSAYGTQHPEPLIDDPIADVCKQVQFHQRRSKWVAEQIPSDRVFTIKYEEFCSQPGVFLEDLRSKIGGDILKLSPDADKQPAQFSVSESSKISNEEFERLIQCCEEF